MNEPVDDLAARAAVRLRRLATRVTDRRPIAAHSLSFHLSALADLAMLVKIDGELKGFVTRNERVIYQFTADVPAAYEALRLAFERRPAQKPGDQRLLNYSRLMASNVPAALYVGSGTDLRARIGQHLGRIGGPGTYAMRLALWAAHVPATIELKYWLYEPDLDPIELEALEQELWDVRTPLLGKRSGK